MMSNRTTRRKSGQEYHDPLNTKPTVKKITQNKPQSQYFSMEDPYDLSQRFRNLQNALKFIENPKIRNLDKNYFDLKNQLKKEQESKAQFSKAIYKKVISRDNDFNFQYRIDGQDSDITDLYNQKHSGSAGERQKAEKMPGDVLNRKFKHGNMSEEAKKERRRQQSQIPLLFKHVKAIETAQFDAYKDVQFYDLIKGEASEKEFGHQNNSPQLQTLAIQNMAQNFKHNLITQSQYHNQQSYNFLFNCDRQLTFWRLQNIFKDNNKSDMEVLSNCAFFDPTNITIFQVLDFGSRNIEINDLIMLYDLKDELQVKMDMDKNNDSLEQKFNEAKKRFEEMKQLRLKSKNQRLPAKYVNSVAQTNDQMQEKDFDDYFVLDAKNIFDRLEELNDIRDKIIQDEDGETFKVMATNIGLQIGKELFKLLMLVLKGEKQLNYSNFVRAENEQEVEKKILELIYLEFKNFTEYEVGGVSKVEIIKRYLGYRQKNERFYETFLFKNMAQNTSKPTKQAVKQTLRK